MAWAINLKAGRGSTASRDSFCGRRGDRRYIVVVWMRDLAMAK